MTYSERLGQNEINLAEKNMFRLQEFGGIEEADRLINYYRSQTELSQEEEDALRMNAPKSPQFPLISKKEYDSKLSCNKNRYRKKVKGYFEYRKKYYTARNTGKRKGVKTKGEIFAKTREAIEKRIKEKGKESLPFEEETNLIREKQVQYPEKKQQDKIKDIDTENEPLLQEARQKGYYPDIEKLAQDTDRELTEVMDEEYERLQNDEEYEKIENKIGKNEILKLQAEGGSDFRLGVVLWVGHNCQQVKEDMHRGVYNKSVRSVKNTLIKRPLSRDVVVRRGVSYFSGLTKALGINSKDPEEIKSVLEERINSGKELILNESAMMSTAFPFAKTKYDAGRDGDIGIEYIILVKKGTTAANIISMANFKNEGELLIAQNTKFRVIKTNLDGDAHILHGNKKSWKIYLETIPESENGVKNEYKED